MQKIFLITVLLIGGYCSFEFYETEFMESDHLFDKTDMPIQTNIVNPVRKASSVIKSSNKALYFENKNIVSHRHIEDIKTVKMVKDDFSENKKLSRFLPDLPDFKFDKLFPEDIANKILTLQNKAVSGDHFSNSLVLEFMNKIQADLLQDAQMNGENALFDSEQWKALYRANIFHAIQGCRTQNKDWCRINIAQISLGIIFSSREDTYSWRSASREKAELWVGFPADDTHLSLSHSHNYIPEDMIDQATLRANIIRNAIDSETWDFEQFSEAYWNE